jgi:L-cystine transport system permease protein
MNKAFDLDFVFRAIPEIVQAVPISLFIMSTSLIIGFILGLLLTVMKVRKDKVLSPIATAYVSFMRGTPTLIQLFLIYYGLPPILELAGFNINNWSKVVFAIITFSLNCGAFLSEVMRSAYLAVERGQMEAAYSVGMSTIQGLWRVVFPQAFAIALPNLGNSVISLLKETSVAFLIGVNDIMGRALIVSGRGYGIRHFETYIAVSLVYWAIVILMEKGLAFLETIYKKGHKEIVPK